MENGPPLLLALTAFLTFAGAIVTAIVTSRKALLASKIESRRVAIEEFKAHMTFYERQIADLTERIERQRQRADRLEVELARALGRERELNEQITTLQDTVDSLRRELAAAEEARRDDSS